MLIMPIIIIRHFTYTVAEKIEVKIRIKFAGLACALNQTVQLNKTSTW